MVSKEQLSEQALGRPLARFDRNIDMHISSLRHKLGHLPDAIDNIVRNAVKHAPVGSSVFIKASLRSEQAQIDIVDNGGGVAADELDRIFEPYTRGRNAVGAGHGLGLAIARRAIQAHVGQVSAQNTDAGGLCVSIRLPN